MFSHIRKQQQLRAKATNGPVKAKRQFGDYRMDYIKACVHDMKSKNPEQCPLCKLTSYAVRQHFEKEAEERRLARLTSLVRRARLRYSLLESWTHNQAYFCAEVMVGFVVEVSLNEAIVKALIALSEEDNLNFLNFRELSQILARRKRIKEIGHYTAIFLQAFIRKVIAFRKVRRDILSRFELIPATRSRGAFLLDTASNRHWSRLPNILSRDRPASPSTMGRRLGAEERKRNQRRSQYTKIMERMKAEYINKGHSLENYLTINLFEQEKFRMNHLKQMTVLRDVILSAMTALTKLLQGPEKITTESEPLPVSLNFGEGIAESITEGSLALRPVWLAMTAPSPPAFQVAYAMAMQTPFDPSECFVEGSSSSSHSAHLGSSHILGHTSTMGSSSVVSLSPSKVGHSSTLTGGSGSTLRSPGLVAGGAGSSSNSIGSIGSVGSLGSKGSTDAPHIDYNRALKLLEQRAWDGMCCATPEDVIKNLLFADYHAAIESALNFASDENKVWVGAMDVFHQPTAGLSSIASGKAAASNTADDDDEGTAENAGAAETLKTNTNINSVSDAVGAREGTDPDMPPNPRVRFLKSDKSFRAPAPAANSGKEKDKSVIKGSQAQTVDPATIMNRPDEIAVLPASIQLRPFPTDRNPGGIFRLFFFDNELVAATQMSRFVFYSDVLKHRDQIVTSIRSFVQTPAVQHLVRSYFHKCAAPSRATSRVSTAAGGPTPRRAVTPVTGVTGVTPRTARRGSFGGVQDLSGSLGSLTDRGRHAGANNNSVNTPVATVTAADVQSTTAGDLVSHGPRRRSHSHAANHYVKHAPRTSGESIGGVVSLYTPPHTAIYGSSDVDITACSTVATMADDDILANHAKYSFLNKVPAWKAMAVRAQNNKMKRPKHRLNAADRSGTTIDSSKDVRPMSASASSKVGYSAPSSAMSYSITLPPSSDLVGNEISTSYPEAALISSTVSTSQAALAAYEKTGMVGAMAATMKNYRDRLQFLTNSVVTAMQPRTQIGLESPEVKLGPAAPAKVLDLLVIEVYVDLRPKKSRGVAESHGAGNTGTNTYGTYAESSREMESSRSITSVGGTGRDFSGSSAAPTHRNTSSLTGARHDTHHGLHGLHGHSHNSHSQHPSHHHPTAHQSHQSHQNHQHHQLHTPQHQQTDTSTSTNGLQNTLTSEIGTINTGRSMDASPGRGSFEGFPNAPTARGTVNTTSNHLPGSHGGGRRGAHNTTFKPSVEMWQVMGIFSTELARPPPSIELGLFDWEYFHQLRAAHEASKLTEWQKPLDAKLALRITQSKERMWSRTDELSGLAIHKAGTTAEKDFQLRILGCAPTKGYLEANLPTKTKRWLGLC